MTIETATYNFDAMTDTLSADRAKAAAEIHEQELNAFTLAAELAAQSANVPPIARNASVARNGKGDLWRSLMIADSAIITLTGTAPTGNAMANPASTKAIAFKTLQDAITNANGNSIRVIDVVGKRGIQRSYLAWFAQDRSVAFDGLTGEAMPCKAVPA